MNIWRTVQDSEGQSSFDLGSSLEAASKFKRSYSTQEPGVMPHFPRLLSNRSFSGIALASILAGK